MRYQTMIRLVAGAQVTAADGMKSTLTTGAASGSRRPCFGVFGVCIRQGASLWCRDFSGKHLSRMSNETIFREVDEELRGDRMRALWRRFGPYIIGAAVAVVLVVAINEGWRWWQNSNAARSSDQFYAALELAEARRHRRRRRRRSTRSIASGVGGYPLLARFRQASLLARDGKDAEAVAAYDALATAETNPRLRELALVLAANLLVDSGDVAAVQQRVGGLVAPGNAAAQRRARSDRACPVQGRRPQRRARRPSRTSPPIRWRQPRSPAAACRSTSRS